MKLFTPLKLSLLGAIIFAGCATREIVFSQNKLCETPLASLYLHTIVPKSSQSTLKPEEFKSLLLQTIKPTGCFDLISSPQENSYTLNVVYEVSTKNQEKDEILKVEIQNSLTAKVTLNLSNQKELRQEVGISTINTEGKRFLGIGEDVSISREDEQNATRNAILTALKSFIKTLQSLPQTTPSQESPQQDIFP